RRSHAPWGSDEAPSLWVAAALAAIATLGYGVLAGAALAKGTVFAHGIGPLELATPAAVVTLIVFAMWGARTRFAQRGFWLVVAALWVLPMMLLTIAAAAGAAGQGTALVGALSPVWV